ncbi:MAG TPA: sugar transferase, partial [Chthoniobacterales bacterium]
TAEFFNEYLSRLEEHAVEYAILHGYEDFPERFESDIDYVVPEAQVDAATQILHRLARARGWSVAQVCEHELFARYTVVIDPDNAAHHLAFDVYSHFVKQQCFLLRDTVLLHERQRHERGFFVAAPAAEFIYLLAKSLRKHSRLARYLPRLRELAACDPVGTQRAFDDFYEPTGRAVDEWLRGPLCDFEQLEWRVVQRQRYTTRLRVAEALRRLHRAMHPCGLHVAFLGPDGSGKSTVIDALQRSLAPCFERQRTFRFRPDMLDQIGTRIDATPHRRPPRGRLVSLAKTFYYFGDWWLGLFLRLLPERRRGSLVILDRDFNDLAVDQRRYLVQGVGWLARILRRFVPRADLTFVLDGEAAALHARKPELPVAELERQRIAFQRLAARDRRMRLVAVEKPAADVAREVAREVIVHLGDREQRRVLPRSKRIFDFLVAALALVALAPLIAVIAFLVRVKLGTPVVFAQPRPGLLGRPFTIWKFRTMTDARNANGRLLPDAERLTRFGHFLRKSSLDELPELVNVLRGEMSLVGPRPLLVDYLPLYSEEQMRRHEVLPGITGWAQINGRNAARWPRKFALDVWYVDHQSLWLDLKIIARTLLKVVRREGVDQPGGLGSERFRGEVVDAEERREQTA